MSDTRWALTASLRVMYTPGLPIARLPRVERKRMIAGTGLEAEKRLRMAKGFGTLVARGWGGVRRGVECRPDTDDRGLLPPRKRAQAMEVWGLSNPFGTMMGFSGREAGYPGLGWREAFPAVRIAGWLSPLVLTVKERSGGVRRAEGARERALREALDTLEAQGFRLHGRRARQKHRASRSHNGTSLLRRVPG